MALQTQVFNYTGGWQSFNVPAGVTFLILGAVGGGTHNSQGGRIIGNARVKPSDTIHIAVGRRGHGAAGSAAGAGGWPNGGDGGDGSNSHPAGDGGGGASYVRLNSQSGTLLTVAGGAGGDSGDGGIGGNGGPNTGQDGHRPDGAGNVAQGGSQTKGGNGGTTGAGQGFDGSDAQGAILGNGGKGGQAANSSKTIGGGGGGGGFHSGGGGQAGKAGAQSGGGGGGGANFVGNLYQVAANDRGGLVNSDGFVVVQWYDAGDLPPNAPSSIKLNGVDKDSSEMITAAYDVTITGKPTDSTLDEDVRMYIGISTLPAYHSPGGEGLVQRVAKGTWDPTNQRDSVTLNGLPGNTLWFCRIYSQDKRGSLSNSWAGLKFWTNRQPDPPTLTAPADDTVVNATDPVVFGWTFSDPDDDTIHHEHQASFILRWRRKATPLIVPGAWSQISGTAAATWTAAPGTFLGGNDYEWQVQVTDQHGARSDWSNLSTISVIAVAVPPLLVSPITDQAQITADQIDLVWQFRTLIGGEYQTTADVRYRPFGATTWTQLDGDTVTPGRHQAWSFPPATFAAGFAYEWQVATHTSSSTVSDWSESGFFWVVDIPGLGDPFTLDDYRPLTKLGQGHNRAFVYERGGERRVAEITPLADIAWGRTRDDMDSCVLHVNEWSDEQREFYSSLESWAHEIVVFRTTDEGTERVFEGPLVRVSGTTESLEIEAKDVMGYVYRRIMRQGYNDSFQIDALGNQLGLKTVVYRARQIILNALAYDDPNLLKYLTTFDRVTDSRQSRIVKDYVKSAWDEVDDLAANAGLDYAVIGRRILLFDTHTPIGRLPELRDGDFSSSPVVTQYGMSFATDSVTTNGNGIYGIAVRRQPDGSTGPTGFVEIIANQYGESDTPPASDELTAAQLAELQATLTAQAERNIGSRWPMPIIVRVPDNSSLNPHVPIGINQLVPGVWMPVRATRGVVVASQWQKLDSMRVTEYSTGEKVSVVMSPAPNAGADPDADLSGELG